MVKRTTIEAPALRLSLFDKVMIESEKTGCRTAGKVQILEHLILNLDKMPDLLLFSSKHNCLLKYQVQMF